METVQSLRNEKYTQSLVFSLCSISTTDYNYTEISKVHDLIIERIEKHALPSRDKRGVAFKQLTWHAHV